MTELRHRYKLHSLAHSTVREYTRYLDVYPALVGPDGDVKDVQRPWAFDQITQFIPHGGKIIDMGGSYCQLAAELMDDYDVTIIDPYDGSGGGPVGVDSFRKRYPKVTFVPDMLTPKVDLPCDYDAVVSTSVLEHVEPGNIHDALVGIDGVLKQGGFSMHAIDFTARGEGRIKEVTDAVIQQFFDSYGVSVGLDEVREAALADYETYYLSPQMYQRWRKDRSYDEYPWRLVTSINVIVQKTADRSD